MRLKKGSYFYILGIFFFGVSFLCALLSGIAGISYSKRLPVENPLLSDFGNLLVGTLPVIIFTFLFSVTAFFLSFAILSNGLKRGSLVRPLRFIGWGLIVFSLLAEISAIFFLKNENFKNFFFNYSLRLIPLFITGLILPAVAANKRSTRMPAIFFGSMSAYAAFTDFSFENILLCEPGDLTDTHLLGFGCLFFFSLSIGLFFTAICLCVGSCEYKAPKNSRNSRSVPEFPMSHS